MAREDDMPVCAWSLVRRSEDPWEAVVAERDRKIEVLEKLIQDAEKDHTKLRARVEVLEKLIS